MYLDRYDYRSGESFSELYIRYANMASMLTLAMSTHYEPRIQACLIGANVKSTHEALAVLTKLQSLENLKYQYRTPRRDFEHQDQTRRTPRGTPSDSVGNRRRNGSVLVCHVRRDNRDKKSLGQSVEVFTYKLGAKKFFRRSGETR